MRASREPWPNWFVDTAALPGEVEDIEAVIREAGGSAFVYGISSGAALALDAGARTSAITKLVVYEAPFIVDDSRPPIPKEYARTMRDLLAAGNRGAAVKQFMRLSAFPAFSSSSCSSFRCGRSSRP